MSEIETVDICCGLCWGDEAKGKIISTLLSKNKYDWVCRWNGGSNAGHTIYINGVKYATHIIPAGVFYGVPCYIGPDCLINNKALKREIDYLNENGFDTSNIYFSSKAHVVSDKHIEEDCSLYKKQQGSTGMGIAPCSRDKYARLGHRIEDDETFPYKEKIWRGDSSPLKGNILCEGSQGFWLDINYGSYPYVTSSCTLPYSACSLGFPPQKIRDIYGAAKVYDTRVGVDPHFSHRDCKEYDEIFSEIANVAEEYGTTTKRLRKIEWLNMDKLLISIKISGANKVIISKIDILDKVNKYLYIHDGKYVEFEDSCAFKNNVNLLIKNNCKLVTSIIYSDNPMNI